MIWQVQKAKQRFSELMRRTLEDGPQVVSRHGKDAVVVVSVKDYEQLLTKASPGKGFKQFLMDAPDFDELDIRRDESLPRTIELDAS